MTALSGAIAGGHHDAGRRAGQRLPEAGGAAYRPRCAA